MPYYQYLVINQDNKKLTGQISAQDESRARIELNNLGFSIIEISEISKTEYQKIQAEKRLFEFQAYDRHGKKVVGTIPANDKYEAYKKLSVEYLLNVLFLYTKDQTLEKQEIEKKAGLNDLKQRLQTESSALASLTAATSKNASSKAKTADAEDILQTPEYLGLQQHVQIILKKVDEILTKYQNDLNPEKAKAVKILVNKLIRIKSSTNLKYIEKTCEELLNQIQDQELFLKNSLVQDARNKIGIETKKMLIELHQKGSTEGGPTILSSLKSSLKAHGKAANPIQKFLQPLIGNIIKFLEEPEEIKLLRIQKKNIGKQLFTYIRLWFQSPAAEKKEIVSAIKTLLSQRKSIQYEIKKLLKKASQDQKSRPLLINMIYQEINTFTGWLLFFYLLLYFLATYNQTKNLHFIPSYFLEFYNIPLLKYLILIVFSIHAASSIKLNFMERSLIASFLLLPLGIFLSYILVINF